MAKIWQVLFVQHPGQDDPETADPPAFDELQWYWLVADDGLMRINPKDRSVKVVRKDAGLISATGAYKPKTAKKGRPDTVTSSRGVILARTPDRVLVLDLNGKELEAYPLPAELRDVGLEVHQLPGNKALIRENYYGDRLFWFDAAGKIVRHEQVHLQNEHRRNEHEEEIKISLAIPSPGTFLGFLAYYPYPWNGRTRPESMDYWVALGNALWGFRLILLITSGISIVLAGVCFWRQRKYGLPWTAAWTLFVLLFGMPAFLGYLVHRVWPARLPCPNCQRRVPRDRPACFACGHEFPAPAAKGIEVFA
jgi:hypothetical protein